MTQPRTAEQLVQAIYDKAHPNEPVTLEILPSDRKAISDLLRWREALEMHRAFLESVPAYKRGYVEFCRKRMAGG
jgi:hypothetical protein